MSLLEPGHPDREVVEALLAGDETAFRTLVAQHYGAMVRVARRHVATAEVAEEVVQETWLAVLTGLATFEGRHGATLKTWVYSILVNQARARGVRERRVVPLSSVGAAGADDEPIVDPSRFRPDGDRWAGHWSAPPASLDPTGAVVADDDIRRSVEAAIAALPGQQQQVVWLRDVEGWSAAEVCAALGLSEANQRVLLHRGRSKVRAALERHLDGSRR